MRGNRSKKRGFQSAASLVSPQIRKVGEGRGFAVARLLTRWPDIVGDDFAALARPVSVSYGKKDFGATLTLLIQGVNGPMVDMQLPRIREKVNAAYGYNAITKIRVTQTAAEGFAEPQAGFDHAPRPEATPTPEIRSAAKAAAGDATDPGLRAAIERLATNVLTKTNTETKIR